MKLTKKETEIIESCGYEAHYSGEQSLKFWSTVNHPANDQTLYVLACALQDLESRVLRAVNEGVRVRATKIVLSKRLDQRKPKRVGRAR